MATNETLKNQLSQQNQKQVPANQLGLKGLMNTPTMKRKFEEVLHENANAFMSNVMTLVSNDSYLAESEPMSILSGALTAATLNLGLDKNLGMPISYHLILKISRLANGRGKPNLF